MYVLWVASKLLQIWVSHLYIKATTQYYILLCYSYTQKWYSTAVMNIIIHHVKSTSCVGSTW